MITTAFINLWNKQVGAVAWDSDSGIGSVEFDPSFLIGNWDVSPIKMPLAIAGKKIFSFPELKNNHTFKGLPGLLADVLPDQYGNALINAWLTGQGRPSDSLNPVEMLCFIGQRGMGALEFEPVVPKSNNKTGKIEISSLVQTAGDILSGRKKFHADLSAPEEKAMLELLKIGTSAGGARAKAVIAYNPITAEVRSGQADAPKGFKQWILKFDGVQDKQLGISSGFGRVEMAYSQMATAAGIEMMECQLLEENGRSHFMTRRFDRPDEGGKLHIQSFCAMQHYDFNEVAIYSYEQLFETLRILMLPNPQAEQLFRRMVFNVFAKNCDDHTKNFSFLMGQDGQWKLSPAYDVCYAYRPGSAWVSQHSLSINGKRREINEEDLLSIAKLMTIKKGKEIISAVKQTVNKWPEYAEENKVSVKLRDLIYKTIGSLF